jgi:pimeloyl-ACP methyl ester carboxylesterase
MIVGVKLRRWIPCLVVAVVALLCVPGAQASAVSCTTHTVPVTVAGASLSMSGTYCRPASATPDSVTLLVPGATYNREYWEFGYQPDTYSFARALARRNHASFAIDRLGTGHSSKPLSATITALAQADALHQVIGRLRSAGLEGRPFARVFIAGHSLGSAIALVEGASYNDVDGVIVTGLAHHMNVPALTRLLTVYVHPAILDPAFAGTTLDPGYLTTVPGKRKQAFHDPGQVDPGVIVHDEETKDVFSLTEAPDAVALGVLLSYSDRITAPVLIVEGQEDPYFCKQAADCSTAMALYAQEQPYYSKAPCLRTIVMPEVAHDINLHPNAPIVQTQVADWADAVSAGGCPNKAVIAPAAQSQ